MSADGHDSKDAAVIDRRYSAIFSQLLRHYNLKRRRIQGKLRFVYRRRGAPSAAAQQLLRVAKEMCRI